MFEIISILCLLGGAALLYCLSKIDLREGLLPNELVAGFMSLGVIFNLSTFFSYTSLAQMGMGALLGGGILWIIRAAAYKYYQDDALGLGDVKLLGAAGIWLGPDHILFALILGAMAGLTHGIGMAAYTRIKTGKTINIATLSIPAGPGFAIGIILVAAYKFRDLPLGFLS